jgi:Sec-independent protein translocase protein TatA
MEVLGIGPLEFIFVLLIALIIIGPRDMSKAARTLGRSLNRLYKSESWRAVVQASRNLRTLPNRLAREAEMTELMEARKALKEAGEDVARDVQSLQPDLKAWTTPPGASHAPGAGKPPTPPDPTSS